MATRIWRDEVLRLIREQDAQLVEVLPPPEYEEGLGALIVGGVERKSVSLGMTSFRERTAWLTNGFVTATGSYLLVLFGGVLLYRWVTL